MSDATPPARPVSYDKKVALVLQGGGALGSYQAGVYEALELKDTPEAKWLYNFGCVTTMDIVQLIYRPREPQGASKDYEFGRATIALGAGLLGCTYHVACIALARTDAERGGRARIRCDARGSRQEFPASTRWRSTEVGKTLIKSV